MHHALFLLHVLFYVLFKKPSNQYIFSPNADEWETYKDIQRSLVLNFYVFLNFQMDQPLVSLKHIDLLSALCFSFNFQVQRK